MATLSISGYRFREPGQKTKDGGLGEARQRRGGRVEHGPLGDVVAIAPVNHDFGGGSRHPGCRSAARHRPIVHTVSRARSRCSLRPESRHRGLRPCSRRSAGPAPHVHWQCRTPRKPPSPWPAAPRPVRARSPRRASLAIRAARIAGGATDIEHLVARGEIERLQHLGEHHRLEQPAGAAGADRQVEIEIGERRLAPARSARAEPRASPREARGR